MPFTGDFLSQCISFINDQIAADRLVAIYAPESHKLYTGGMEPFLLVAYLIGCKGMSFADAYTLAVMQNRLIWLDAALRWELVQYFNLPYDRYVVHDGYFLQSLIVESHDAVHRIIDNLYLSSITALENVERARALDIRAVLRLDNLKRERRNWPSDFRLLDMPVHDGTALPSDVIHDGVRFIEQHISTGQAILVHCHAGVSRSAALVMAYLLQHKQMSLPNAFYYIIQRRPVAHPHPALLASLNRHYNLGYEDSMLLTRDVHNRLLKAARLHTEAT